MVTLFNGRVKAKTNRKRAVRPFLEGLEDRMLLYAVTGDHFTYGTRITWSIMPDNTALGSYSSNLVSTLNNEIGPENSTWLPAIQDAFAEWEAVANVNFAQVSDNGAPFDSGNLQQDSSSFGDIRIGGMAQNSNVLGFTLLPPAANGGSDAGDILLNTAQSWHINNDYDLETVLLHEIGHALGMAHSASSSAAMYAYYNGVQQYPVSDDIQGVDSIWGARQEDPIASQYNNHSFGSAVGLNYWINTNNNQVIVPLLDVASTSESYWFKITTPSNASNVFTAEATSSGLSELSPQVQVYSSSGSLLTQASASSQSYGATVYTSITNATPNTTYYIRVLGSNGGDTGSGGYTLMANMGYGYLPAPTPPNTQVATQADQGGGAAYDQTGGVNNASNTPLDLPDLFNLGAITVEGDALTARKGKHADVKHGLVQIKVAHPTRAETEKTVKVGKTAETKKVVKAAEPKKPAKIEVKPTTTHKR